MNFKQKIDPQAGFTQLSGSGSPEGSAVGWVGQTYRNTDNNDLYEKSTGDGTNTGWVQKTGAGATIPDATELQAGKVELATQLEAETGTDNTNKAMNPLKTKQAFDAFIAAHESQKINFVAYNDANLSYSTDTVVEFANVATNLGSGLSYASGIFTVSKSCRLLLIANISFLNNGAPSSDACSMNFELSTDGGSNWSDIAGTFEENVSEQTDETMRYSTCHSVSVALSNGDKVRYQVKGVNLTQSFVSRQITVFEQ